MDLQFKPIGRKRCHRVRAIARAAHINNPGNPERAKAEAAETIKTEFAISSILMGIAMKLIINAMIGLAAKFIMNWAINQVTTPPVSYSVGEIGYEWATA